MATKSKTTKGREESSSAMVQKATSAQLMKFLRLALGPEPKEKPVTG